MNEFTFNTRFKRALKGESLDMVPVCSVTQTGTVELMEMTGAYWPQANYDASKMAALAWGDTRLQDLRTCAVLSALQCLPRLLAVR